MNTQSSAMPESFQRGIAPAVTAGSRPLYWSIRRELWEYRSIYIAPLIAAAIFLIGFSISAFHLPGRVRAAMALDPMHQHEALAEPYVFAEGMFMVTAMIIGAFYCLQALQSERRDRSILFWKSLPVSDLTTVLAKASIPLLILPLCAVALTVVTQGIMLLLSSAVLAANGMSATALWTQLSLFQMSLMLLYHLTTVHVLMHAPFYGWLLMVSAWARRAAFLWASLPVLGIIILEKLVFNTNYFASMLLHRLAGGTEVAPFPGKFPIDAGMQLSPGHFLLSPGLWIGLAITALFLAAAVRLRRYRGPI